jgi:hypothetical protein
VPLYGEDLYLTFIDPTPEDKAAKMDEMAKAVGSMPVITQNEARQNYLGFGPVAGGDQLMAPNTMTLAGTTSKPEGEDVNPQAAKTVEGWPAKAVRVRTGGKTAHSGASQMRRALAKAFKAQLEKVPAFQTKSFSELTKDEYHEHWKRFADRSERAQAELHEIFQGINAKQKADVLEAIAELPGLKKTAAKAPLINNCCVMAGSERSCSSTRRGTCAA